MYEGRQEMALDFGRKNNIYTHFFLLNLREHLLILFYVTQVNVMPTM